MLQCFELSHTLAHSSRLSTFGFKRDEGIWVIGVRAAASTILLRESLERLTHLLGSVANIVIFRLDGAHGAQDTVLILSVTCALPLSWLLRLLLGYYNFVEDALCIRVKVEDLLNTLVRLVKNFNVPFLSDDTLVKNLLVDQPELQVLNFKYDLNNQGLHDTGVNSFNIFLKL
jgi:hypothetical protein